jgi:hypothetical protein
MGPPAPEIAVDPDQLRNAAAVEEDRIDAIRKRASADTRDTLIRFGRQRAFGSGGLFGGPKLGLLGSLGGA